MIIGLRHGPRDRTNIEVEDPEHAPQTIRFISSVKPIHPGHMQLLVHYHIYSLYRYGGNGKFSYQYHYTGATDPEVIDLPNVPVPNPDMEFDLPSEDLRTALAGITALLSEEEIEAKLREAGIPSLPPSAETVEDAETLAESASSDIVVTKRRPGRPPRSVAYN